MHPLRKQLNKNKIIRACSSVKITVVCLSLLFILTLWGTIDQVYNGLYLSQARFFNSWAFTFWGFVPFPGARLVLWVLFINLVCVSMVRLVYRWSHAGIIITHFGLLLFFVAAFVTFHGTQESNITLKEGQGTNVASAYHHWELSVWQQEGEKKQVVAIDADHFKSGQKINLTPYGFTATVVSYCGNCEAYGDVTQTGKGPLLNVSGVQELKPIALDIEPTQNFPGGIFEWHGADQGEVKILLYGAERDPLKLTKDGKDYFVQLRKKRFPMPFMVKLKEFTMEKHPNTEIARTYESLVEVLSHGTTREVLISMNEPLRHKNYTFYQASYSIDRFGNEYSTLAVVKNTGRLLPYIATFVTVAGLIVHLLIMAFGSKLKAVKP